MDATAAYEELLQARGPVPEWLDSTRRGVYVLWMDTLGFKQLGVRPGLGGTGYAGVAAGSGGLRKRFVEEWRPPNSGRSSPRRTIGALLRAQLDLVPCPRHDKDSERAARYYVFAGDGEERLTMWIDVHCEFAYLEETPVVDARQLESDLIPYLGAPLNIRKWSNPIGPRLEELRHETAALARKYV